MRFLQALTPRERYFRFIVASQSEPLSRHRERGWGERADTPVATLGAILCAVRIDFRREPKINPYPAQPATGVLGQSPKRVLVPFTRVKGTPRRRAVQTKISKKLSPPKVPSSLDKAASRRLGCGTVFCRGMIPPEAEPYHFVQSDPTDLENRRYYEQHRTGKTKPL